MGREGGTHPLAWPKLCWDDAHQIDNLAQPRAAYGG